LTAAVKSQEDHGYILDLGIPDISGFLPFNERKNEDTKLHIGVLLNVTITKVSENGRTCTLSADHATFTSSYVCPRSTSRQLSAAHF
jgi:rRNA biogenesis protein RRP5